MKNILEKDDSSYDMDENLPSFSFDDKISITEPFQFFRNKQEEEDDNDYEKAYFIPDVTKNKSFANSQSSTNGGTNSKNEILTINQDINYKKNLSSNSENITDQASVTKFIKRSEKIFHIDKVNKILGRLPKDHRQKKYFTKHNEFSQDNIIQKIKVRFYEHIYNYINYRYELYLKDKNRYNKETFTKLIQRISPKGYKTIKKEDNLKWFSSKIKDILSYEISSKYRQADKSSNKKRIKSLYLKNEAKDIINILEKSVREMYYIYCNNIYIDGFHTLKDDLNYFREKMKEKTEEEIQKYLTIYEKTSIYLEEIFLMKKSRKRSI